MHSDGNGGDNDEIMAMVGYSYQEIIVVIYDSVFGANVMTEQIS